MDWAVEQQQTLMSEWPGGLPTMLRQAALIRSEPCAGRLALIRAECSRKRALAQQSSQRLPAFVVPSSARLSASCPPKASCHALRSFTLALIKLLVCTGAAVEHWNMFSGLACHPDVASSLTPPACRAICYRCVLTRAPVELTRVSAFVPAWIRFVTVDISGGACCCVSGLM